MGGVVEGQFDNHYANGFCTVFFANGDSYKGFLVQGQMHGKGIKYTRSSDTWAYNVYTQGEPVQEIYKGEGEPINIEINVETDGIATSNLKMNQDLYTSESYEVQKALALRIFILFYRDK